MNPGYLWTLSWANLNLGSLYDFVTKNAPELRASWPTKPWGGFEAESYSLNDGLALLIVRATGGQMPYPKNQQPVPLTKAGCPVSDKLDIIEIIEWARTAFGLAAFDSAFVMPRVEVPTNQQEFERLPEDVRKAMLAQLDYEWKRIASVLKGLAQKVTPPSIVIRAQTVQNIMGDYVAGDKVQGNKTVIVASTQMTGEPSMDIAEELAWKFEWLLGSPPRSGAAPSPGYDLLSHPELIARVETWLRGLEAFFGHRMRVTVLQSVNDKGVDVLVEFYEVAVTVGLQIKSHAEIGAEDFTSTVKRQALESNQYNLKRWFLMAFADLENKTHARKLSGITAEFAQFHTPRYRVAHPLSLGQVLGNGPSPDEIKQSWEEFRKQQRQSAEGAVNVVAGDRGPHHAVVPEWPKILADLQSKFYDNRLRALRTLEELLLAGTTVPKEICEELYAIFRNGALPGEERGLVVNLLYRAHYFNRNAELIELYLREGQTWPREISMWVGNYFGYYRNIQGLRGIMDQLRATVDANAIGDRTLEEMFTAIRAHLSYPVLLTDEDREAMLDIASKFWGRGAGQAILGDILERLTGFRAPM